MRAAYFAPFCLNPFCHEVYNSWLPHNKSDSDKTVHKLQPSSTWIRAQNVVSDKPTSPGAWDAGLKPRMWGQIYLLTQVHEMPGLKPRMWCQIHLLTKVHEMPGIKPRMWCQITYLHAGLKPRMWCQIHLLTHVIRCRTSSPECGVRYTYLPKCMGCWASSPESGVRYTYLPRCMKSQNVV